MGQKSNMCAHLAADDGIVWPWVWETNLVVPRLSARVIPWMSPYSVRKRNIVSKLDARHIALDPAILRKLEWRK